MRSTVFGFMQGASLCFCSTKTLPAVAGTNLPFAPDGRKRGTLKK